MISYLFLSDEPRSSSPTQQELVVCQTCGAVVTYGMWTDHSNWHFSLTIRSL